MACIHKHFEEYAQRNPDAVAIVYRNQHVTYSELDRRSSLLAGWLQYVHEIKVGESIAVFLDKSIELVILILSIWKVGGIFIPLNPRVPLDFTLKILEKSKSRRCITNHEFFEQIDSQVETIFIMVRRRR